MKRFTDKQLRTVGAAYALNKLTPVTPYGRDAARHIAPFLKAQAGALAIELENVERAAFSGADNSAFTRILPKFRDIRGSVKKLTGEEGKALGEVELFEVKSFLLALSELAEAYARFNGSAGLTGIGIAPMEDALLVLDPERTRLRSFYVNEKYSEKLRIIREKKLIIDAGLNAVNNAETLKELERERLKIVAEEEEEELAVRTALTFRLATHKMDFDVNIDALARLDLTLAKASLAREYGCVKASITENTIMLKDVYSPEADAALKERGGRVTPVSLSLAPGTAVLTGANMGGKSVALKTVALNCYLFQCGFLVFAAEAGLPLFDNIDFIFDDEQSVYSGLSSFGAEMSNVNALLERALNGFSLIILDEPARGTNPREGRAIAAGLAACLNGLSSISILSTHYDNVAKEEYNCYMAAGLKKELLAALESDKKRLSPEMIPGLMDYRLIKAQPADSVPNDALGICKLLGVCPSLLNLVEKFL
ncbi:MAG: hypothetical protein FWE91_01145 [Defluviitaleaceae bacterium]|nr:hypothetical protein [Defluviitaleaceae bacterium]MCL2835528.1 hypothetical protein [Defluviitaleaceae bacterium]